MSEAINCQLVVGVRQSFRSLKYAAVKSIVRSMTGLSRMPRVVSMEDEQRE